MVLTLYSLLHRLGGRPLKLKFKPQIMPKPRPIG